MNYCCVCLEKKDTKQLGQFKNAFICINCNIIHKDILEFGDNFAEYYDFIKTIENNLKLIKKMK